MSRPLRVVVWNEHIHERTSDHVRSLYPQGLHAEFTGAIREHLGDRVEIRVATLDDPEHGLTHEVLSQTDVITWWGHAAHDRVADEIVDRVHQRVLDGMGFVGLHSAHASKIFRKLMGTSCMLRWREAAEKERVWTLDPGHPLAEGLTDEHFDIPQSEMYGEFFDIAPPDEIVFVSWFEGGEILRSGCTWRRGKGRVCYFSPGHETFPIYKQREVRRIVANAVAWAAPQGAPYFGQGRNIPVPLSPIAAKHVVDESLHKPK